VASAFFLLSRYEELINTARDEHGRFAGKNSLPCRANFLHRPVVDEYGRAFRKLLKDNGFALPDETSGINKIFLTHDVDKLAYYRNLRSLVAAFVHGKNRKLALKSFFGKPENDCWFTFPWLFEQDNLLKNRNVEKICFVLKANKTCIEDRTKYNFRNKDFLHFLELCQKNGVQIGLHASYAAGKNPIFIAQEKKSLEKAIGQSVTFNRNHYLCAREPQDFRTLIHSGITADFTMGYADVAGFRLGTSKAVRWIDAIRLEITNLHLHHLLMMDNTLSDEKYMHLTEKEAFDYAVQLIAQTEKFNGDLSLLWHNSSVAESYHRNLYSKIIEYLAK
jgi:hypothetical protein